ncbi:MAG: periplasmic heavy metal sensor [Thermoanaerobaculia bacterium]|nr:periplasmic heavy metal sensor [Thermoanaerobaculia bacterium]
MMKKLMVAAIAAVLVTSSALAADLPPGKWWRRAEVAERLALSQEQQSKLDGVFRDAANDLIDRKGEVEKLTVALRGELDQPQLNRDDLRRLASRLTDARGKLFERELMMLVDMRAVLNDAQWTRLRAELDRQREQMREPMRQPMRQPMKRPMTPRGRRQ